MVTSGKIINPIETVDKLTKLGVISSEVTSDLRYAIDSSRAGRIFGHPSANALPKTLYAVAEKCSVLCDSDPEASARCREIFDAKLLVRRPRRVTALNVLLAIIQAELDGKEIENPAPTPKKTWFKRALSLLQRR